MAGGYQHEVAFDCGHLQVDDIHELYYEQYGHRHGKPVIYLHGGPGGRTTSSNAEFFDPKVYRVVLLDQRGCGKSTPHAELKDNTTWHLVSDIEDLRQHLGIQKWHLVFGGSWGSTLALAYAQTHPRSVGSLLLRGIFAMRKIETDFMFGPSGTAMLYPDTYDKFIDHLPEKERHDPAAGYMKLLTSDDMSVRREAAKVWNSYEVSVSKVDVPAEDLKQVEDDDWSLAHGRIEAHYFTNGAFMEDGYLLKEENIAKIRLIPTTIVQGRLDLVCPARTAWELHKLLPESTLYMIPVAGHSAKEPGTFAKLIEVCDAYGKEDF